MTKAMYRRLNILVFLYHRSQKWSQFLVGTLQGIRPEEKSVIVLFCRTQANLSPSIEYPLNK